MSNCLVTKLIAPIDNPNLRLIGQLDIDFKITESTPAVNKVDIITTSPIQWECDAICYNKVSTDATRRSLGRQGTFATDIKNTLFIDVDAKLVIHPMYGITNVNIPSTPTGQLNLNSLVLDSDTLTISAAGGVAYYGDFENLSYNILHNSVGGTYIANMPLSKNLKGYNKYTYNGTGKLAIQTPQEGAEFYNDWYLDNYMDDDADLCGILDGNGVAANLERVQVGFFQKGIISNIEDFSVCTNLVRFVAHNPKSIGGNISDAFKGCINLTSLTVQRPDGIKEAIETMLNGMKAAGRVSSSISVYGSSFTLNGVPLGSRTVMFTFDAQGNWTRT